jgi:hypothetical protein
MFQLPLVGFRPAMAEIALAIVKVEPGDHPIAIEADVIAQTRGELRIGLNPVEGSAQFTGDFPGVDQVGNVSFDPRRRVETGKAGGIREMSHCILSFDRIVCSANK